jgi:hypothetical protein
VAPGEVRRLMVFFGLVYFSQGLAWIPTREIWLTKFPK